MIQFLSTKFVRVADVTFPLVLQDEIETCMRLLGVGHIHELSMKHINIGALENRVYGGNNTESRRPTAIKAKL